jgi:hypothetical protein
MIQKWSVIDEYKEKKQNDWPCIQLHEYTPVKR